MLMNNAYNNMQNAPVPLFCLWIWREYDFYTHEVHSFFITTKKKTVSAPTLFDIRR